MPLFPFKKKKLHGTSSKIAELQSPYLKKPFISSKKGKKNKKLKTKTPLFTPSVRLQNPKGLKKLIWVIISFGLVAIIVYILFFSAIFTIKSWEIFDSDIALGREHPLHQILARERDKNIFFIDEKSIVQEFRAFFPDIENIQIKKAFPQKIIVEMKRFPVEANLVNVVTENPSKVTACKSLPGANLANTKKFLINSISLLVEENKENPAYPYIKFPTTKALALKDTPFAKEKLDYILKAITLFIEKFDMRIVNATYKIRERELHLCTEKQFAIWIDMEKDLEKQLSKLKKALPKIDIYNTPLEYIDLRISGAKYEKVIFKRRTT